MLSPLEIGAILWRGSNRITIHEFDRVRGDVICRVVPETGEQFAYTERIPLEALEALDAVDQAYTDPTPCGHPVGAGYCSDCRSPREQREWEEWAC